MKIFLDTADTEIIRKYFETGLVDGITTNPTLIMKSGRNPDDVYQELSDMGISDISMEVMGNAQEMLDEGVRLSDKFWSCLYHQSPMYTRWSLPHVENSRKNEFVPTSHSSSPPLRQSLQQSLGQHTFLPL